jgi:methionyl aminopeptidase
MNEFADSQGDMASNSKTYTCATKDCGKPAELACPTCIKLGLNPSRFCNQDCFKTSWNEHKALHKQVKKTLLETKYLTDPSCLSSEFKDFQFTGSLRPWQKTPRRQVPDSIIRPDYADDPKGVPLSEQLDKAQNTSIKVYSSEEIEGMRYACRIGREILDIAGNAVRVGITCDEIDKIVHEATIERGAYPSPLNYHQFPKSVCTSVNEVKLITKNENFNLKLLLLTHRLFVMEFLICDLCRMVIL